MGILVRDYFNKSLMDIFQSGKSVVIVILDFLIPLSFALLSYASVPLTFLYTQVPVVDLLWIFSALVPWHSSCPHFLAVTVANKMAYSY